MSVSYKRIQFVCKTCMSDSIDVMQTATQDAYGLLHGTPRGADQSSSCAEEGISVTCVSFAPMALRVCQRPLQHLMKRQVVPQPSLMSPSSCISSSHSNSRAICIVTWHSKATILMALSYLFCLPAAVGHAMLCVGG